MKANPIRRRFLGDWALVFDAGAVAHRGWVAVCPECGEQVVHRAAHPHYAQATRKNTKDALYRHQQEQHKPGSVGR